MNKRREIPEQEYEALLGKVLETAERGWSNQGTAFAMVTAEFAPTQRMAEVRYMAWDNAYDCGLFQIDDDGNAVLLVKEWFA